MFDETDIPIQELCWKIINHLYPGNENTYIVEKNNKVISLLVNDPNFRKCVYDIEKDIELKIKSFEELMN